MNFDEQRAITRTAVNRVADARGLVAPWPDDVVLPDWLTPDKTWTVEEFGLMRERLMTMDSRHEAGTWYTPYELAESMVRLSIGPHLDRLSALPEGDPLPQNVLQVLVIDPACGAGVFLVAALRAIAVRYAFLLCEGGVPALETVRYVMPEVLAECIFGVDLDPVAVDLTKSVLWLEAGGTFPISDLDRNIIAGNTLDLALPPAFEERRQAYAH